MAVAPGTWQIGVRRGVEHEAIFEEVTIRSGRDGRAAVTAQAVGGHAQARLVVGG